MARRPLQEIWKEEGVLTNKLIIVEGLARDGATNEEIIEYLGITSSTFYEWVGKDSQFPQFRDAVNKGKEVVDFAVESALLKKALDGDVSAMKFWLTNRSRNKWKNNMDNAVDLTTKHQVVIVDDLMDVEYED